MFVTTLGGGHAAGFTLDTTTGDFVATHPDLRIPLRGVSAAVESADRCDFKPLKC